MLKEFKLIFWDFDGVIKDSVEIKTQVYFSLFEPFGFDIAEKVRKHHAAHGGMSRFDKLPIYLEWAGIRPNEKIISEYCENFSKGVLQEVINSPWVPGVENYLRNNHYKQIFVVVSATPQTELEYILEALDLVRCFSRVFGAPMPKQEAIYKTMQDLDCEASECLMIGDANADLKAAKVNQVAFLLRRHKTNAETFSSYFGPSVGDFVQS
jgi:phosphoglycolate phosphatase-like HAD superfamily hydrolase